MINQTTNIRSIKTKLTLFYTAVIFAILIVSGAFLYWVSINLLYKADYEFLEDEIDTVQYVLEGKQLNKVALKDVVVDAPQKSKHSLYHYYIRLYNENHEMMLETPSFNSVIGSEIKIKNTSNEPDKYRYIWYENADKTYLLAQSPVKIGETGKTGYIQIVLDISYQHDTFQNKKNLAFIALFGILISVFVGYLMAIRGLKSLYLLTEAVQKITATSLNQRINPKLWPKELSELGDAFNEMLDRIESSFLRLKQFSSDLSHEMRTPVNNLIGQTEIAVAYTNNLDECKKVMESNLEELHGLSSLIENILFLAHAENPKAELSKERIDVIEEINHICEYYQAIADERNIDITVTGSGTVYANRDLFKRMISNILSNAIKYSKKGGSIFFYSKEVENGLIEITLMDTGVGIAPQHLPRIYDRFYRADNARSSSPNGVGLGLSIVRSIVESHRGDINIVSKLNESTQITIHLPTGM